MSRMPATSVSLRDGLRNDLPGASDRLGSKIVSCPKRAALFLLLVLTVTDFTACLRLTPYERRDQDSDATSTESDTASANDTDTEVTFHSCYNKQCLDRPDAGSCVDGGLTVTAGDGYCVVDTDGDTECRFDTERLKCPGGSCQDEVRCKETSCHGVRCDRPPQSECQGETDKDAGVSGGATLVVYEREGRCKLRVDDGEPECVYDVATTIDCENVCVTDDITGAHCVEEPCRTVVCNQPPARYCAGPNKLVVWNHYGRCRDDDGTCVYDRRVIDCSAKGGCWNGRCVANPCEWALCYRPPARYCSEAARVIDFDPVGTCDATGACVYKEIPWECPDSDCDGGNCGSQACDRRLFCHTPPAPYCNQKREQVFWNDIEPCNNGQCIYKTTVKSCDKGDCKDGRCTQDRCEGPGWPCLNGAPAAYCADGGVAVISSADTCNLDSPSCNYVSENKPCPGGCQAGVCQ